MKPKFHYTSIKANLHLLALMNKYITKLNSFIFWNTFPKHAIGENEKINAFSIWAQCWFTTWNADFYCVLSTFNESSCTQETLQQKRIINLGLHSSAPFLKRYWWKWGLRNIYDLMHLLFWYVCYRFWNFSNGLVYLPIQDTFSNGGNADTLRIITINYMVNSSFNKILQASQMVTLSLYGKNGEKLEAKLKSPVALGCFMRKCNRSISST